MTTLDEALAQVEKLGDADTPPRFHQGKIPNQPMLAFIFVFVRRSGETWIHHFAYDDVWPQEVISQWGSLGVAIWREIRRLMRASLIFELFERGEKVKSAHHAISFGNHLNDNRVKAFTKAAIQIILEREEEKKLARIA